MATTAARVQGWGRAKWKRGLGLAALPAGQVTPDGGDGGPIGLTVEIFVNSAWTDISSFVYYRNNAGVTITRGRQDETSQISPQTAKMILNNRNGQFSPRNPSGPYYGQLTRNTPIRVSRLNNGVRRYRFYGEVPAWPTTSDISGNDVTVTITAAGMLRRLRQGTTPLRSPMFRAYTITSSSTQIAFNLLATPAAYWPCEDGVAATQPASGLPGGTPMAVTGTPKFASDSTSFPGSAALPVLAGSSWLGPVPAVSSTTANSLEFLLSIPAGGDVNGGVVARLLTLGTAARVDLVYNAANSGSLTMFVYKSTGGVLYSGIAQTGLNGFPLLAQLQITPSATPNSVDVALNGEALNAAGGALFDTTTITGVLGAGAAVVVNPGGTLTASTVGHVAYQPTPDTVNVVFNPATAWFNDSPIVRFSRLCGEQNVPAVAVFGFRSITDPDDPTLMGVQTIDTFSTLIQQCVDTMFTPMWEARDQLALMFRSKFTLYNQTAKLTLDMSQHELSGPLEPVDDDTYTRNDLTVSRQGGSSYQAVQATGSMSIQPPPNGVGDYSTNYSLSLGSDDLLPDQAGWRLRFGTLDEPRYPRIPVNLRYPAFTSNVDLLNAALTIDIGDRLDVLNPPGPEYPPDPISQIVQGYTEVLGIFEHGITFNCSPQSPWRVGLLDDATLGRLDTDGSTLAQTYPLGTETAIQVATTSPASPPWTTAGGDFPFDITVGGERMTVTNIGAIPAPATGVDGTFETGVTGWTVANGTFVQSSARAHTGTHSGLLTANSLTTPFIKTAQFPVVANATYMLNCWMMLAVGTPTSLLLVIQWFDAGGNFISQIIPPAIPPSASWVQQPVAATAPSNAATALIELALHVSTTSDAVYIDDLTLAQTTGGTQPFTVTRSVNGVVKSQLAGTDVRLQQPMILSM